MFVSNENIFESNENILEYTERNGFVLRIHFFQCIFDFNENVLLSSKNIF